MWDATLHEKHTLKRARMAIGNVQNACYRSSVTNKPTKVTDRCPLLMTRNCNGHRTKTVTTTTYRSLEMIVSPGPPEPLVTGADTKLVTHNTY
jgi:hypothetical protein